MRQFLLRPDHTLVTFEDLPVINTPRSVTILEFSALSLVVQVEGRLYNPPQVASLEYRTFFTPETLELYSLIGECLCLLSESEFEVIANRTRIAEKLVNVPFAIDKVHSEVDDEWLMAIYHLKGRTLRVSQVLYDAAVGSAGIIGINLVAT